MRVAISTRLAQCTVVGVLALWAWLAGGTLMRAATQRLIEGLPW